MQPLKALIGPVYAPSLTFAVGMGAIKPVMLLAALHLGFSHAAGSAVIGVFGVVAVIAAPVVGRLLARTGDRPALIVAGIAATAAMLIAALALTRIFVHAQIQRCLFVLALILLALAQNVWALGRQSFLASHVPLSFRARSMSMLGGMQRLGEMLGPLVASALLALWFLGSAFWFGVVTCLLATTMVIVLLVPEPAQPAAELKTQEAAASEARNRARPQLFPSLKATLLVGLSVNALGILRTNRNLIVPLWGSFLGIDVHLITLTFAIGAVLDTAMFLFSGGLMDRLGRLAGIFPSLIVMSWGLLVMFLFHNTIGFVAGALILGFGNGFGAGIIMTTGVDLAPTARRAEYLGIWQAIANASQALGPLLVSLSTHLFGVAGSVLVTCAIGCGGAVFAACTFRRAYALVGLNLKGQPLKGAA